MMDQEKTKPSTHGSRNLADEDLTRAVLATFDNAKSARFQQVMQSLVKHLHGIYRRC